MRLCITGGPKTGKSTYVGRHPDLMDVPLRHADEEARDLDWSEASEAVSRWFDEPAPWIIEGRIVPRALRKWLRQHAEGKPCDRIIVLGVPHTTLTPGQSKAQAQIRTHWREILPELELRGVVIEGKMDPFEGLQSAHTDDDGAALDAVDIGEEQGADVPSPLAEYLADPSPDNAQRLVEFAGAGLLTLRDVEAALAQEVVNMAKLAVAEGLDKKTLYERRMARVQIQRVLKEIAGVVKKGNGGGGVQIVNQFPREHLADDGDDVPTEAPEDELDDKGDEGDSEDELDDEDDEG